MGNGNNEPIQFTRGDAERIVNVESTTKNTDNKVDHITTVLKDFIRTYEDNDDEIKIAVKTNTRFRKTFIKVSVWIFSSGGGIGILILLAKQLGWLY